MVALAGGAAIVDRLSYWQTLEWRLVQRARTFTINSVSMCNDSFTARSIESPVVASRPQHALMFKVQERNNDFAV